MGREYDNTGREKGRMIRERERARERIGEKFRKEKSE